MSAKDYKFLYEQSQLQIISLQQQLAQLQKIIFGSPHERFVPGDTTNPQLSLGMQVDNVGDAAITATQQISYTRQLVSVEEKPLQHPISFNHGSGEFKYYNTKSVFNDSVL